MFCGGKLPIVTWKVTLPETPAATDGMIAVTTLPAWRKSMPGGKPPCSTPSLASVSTAPPDTLQRDCPATYAMPAGSVSVICTLLAAAGPEVVDESVTVTVTPPGPLFEESALVTVMTELATAVVSGLACVPGVVSVAETTRSAAFTFAASAGTVPAPTPRSPPPDGSAPVV